MLRVLLVDDERMEREGLKYLFSAHGYHYRVREAKNGAEALECMKAEVFDFVVTDIKMPVMDGIRFLLRAKELYPDVFYIIYSGYSDFAYAKEAISLGVVDYLVKPVNEAEFCETIARVEARIAARKYERIRRAKVMALTGRRPSGEKEQDIEGGGRAVAFYLGAPVLEEGADVFENLISDFFPRAEVFVENEQEGHILLPADEGTDERDTRYLADRLKRLIPRIESACGTYAHFVILPPFKDAAGLARAVQEGKFFLSRRFFAARSLVVEDLKSGSDLLYQSFADIELSLGRGEIEEAEALRLMLETLRDKLPFSNLFTKYALLKRLERLGASLNPGQIEAFLQADHYQELEAFVREVLPEDIFGGAEEGGETAETDRAIRRAKNYIQKHYGEPLTLEQIAAEVYLSPNYFCQLFKKETGKTVITYLTETRLDRALELLADPAIRLGEVARKLGYQNPSYFNLIFKNRYGVPPGAYRERLLAKGHV